MTSRDGYETTKLAWHPAVLDRLRAGRPAEAPLTVHLMPELRCNQSCSWCAYGHRRPGDADPPRRNEALMSDAHLGLETARHLVDDLEEMGARAIELTGGGEPLVWPHVDWFLERMARSSLELALVTNGTALTAERAAAFARTRWTWARVSIDAGTAGGYRAVRRVPAAHWPLAWTAVERLAALRGHPTATERRVGVGHVVSERTAGEVLEHARRARGAGADNVRLSLPFGATPLSSKALGVAQDQARRAAEELGSDEFRVVDLLGERAGNAERAYQDYRRCVTQEVLCVVGGDAQVYSCCTLAFTPAGRLGDIQQQRFRALWPALEARFRAHDSRSACRLPCLYERRNLHALELLADRGRELQLRAGPRPLHESYF